MTVPADPVIPIGARGGGWLAMTVGGRCVVLSAGWCECHGVGARLSVERIFLGCMNDPAPGQAMRLHHGGVRVFAMQRIGDRRYNNFTEHGGAATGREPSLPRNL